MATILVILRLIAEVFKLWLEKDASKKKLKEEALKEVTDGIKKNDHGAITRGFDRIRRMR